MLFFIRLLLSYLFDLYTLNTDLVTIFFHRPPTGNLSAILSLFLKFFSFFPAKPDPALPGRQKTKFIIKGCPKKSAHRR